LWTALKALQNKYPEARFVVYTGDTDATAEDILGRANVPISCFKLIFDAL
jgi:hypothetical protein